MGSVCGGVWQAAHKAVLSELSNVFPHLGPLILSENQFKDFVSSRVSFCWDVVMLFGDMYSERVVL